MIDVTLNRRLILAALSHYKIKVRLSGKNISSKCVGVNCPFCRDSGFHCGVFKNSGNFTCWRCDESGSFYALIREYKGIYYEEYRFTMAELLISFPHLSTFVVEEPEEQTTEEPAKLPTHFRRIDDDCPNVVRRFLKSRQFSVFECKRYKAGFCAYGKYAMRLIVPIYFENNLVGFQGRDVTGKARIKYKTSQNHINNYLYGYDDFEGDTAIVVEGVFDQWRLGDTSLCSFGTKLTARQRRLITELKLNTLIFAWDGDAYNKAIKEMKEFAPFIDNIYVLRLPVGEDPDTLGKAGILSLIEETL